MISIVSATAGRNRRFGHHTRCEYVFLILVCTATAGCGEHARRTEAVANGPTATKESTGERKSKPLSVAVIEFENNTGDSALDPLRKGLRDMIATDLARVGSIRVVERSRLASVMKEQQFSQGHFIDPETAVRVGKGVAATTLLTGSYAVSKDDLRIDLRILAVEEGTVSRSATVVGKKDDLFKLEKHLIEQIVRSLGVATTDGELTFPSGGNGYDFEAFSLFSQALRERDEGHPAKAAVKLRQALARERTFRLAANELAAIESDVTIRLKDFDEHRLVSLGSVGVALRENLRRHAAVIEQKKCDPEYFASLVVASAHAGLAGDLDTEFKLLILLSPYVRN